MTIFLVTFKLYFEFTLHQSALDKCKKNSLANLARIEPPHQEGGPEEARFKTDISINSIDYDTMVPACYTKLAIDILNHHVFAFWRVPKRQFYVIEKDEDESGEQQVAGAATNRPRAATNYEKAEGGKLSLVY